MAAASAGAFIVSRLTHFFPRSPRQLRTPFLRRRPSTATVTVSCLSGGLSDEFVSTRKSTLDRGFSVIANLLKRIEPLDNSVISKGVSDSAKDSMKQTISTMLGLLPSDHFSVTVNVSNHPLYRLLVSSVITGYTLWNAEYRISLMRNFDISNPNLTIVKRGDQGSDAHLQPDAYFEEDFERIQLFRDLSPEALNYIQHLQSELHSVEKELDTQKKEKRRMEFGKECRNDLLEYLRALDSDMVDELSRPSSVEVEEIIQQLVQNIMQRFFNNDASNAETCDDGSEESPHTVGTSRDYLAKLLFWCMLLGHHLRGLENRLQLSCVVGLL